MGERGTGGADLHTLLASLDCGDIASDATADDDQVLLICRRVRIQNVAHCAADNEYEPEAEAKPRLHREREVDETTLGRLGKQ